MIGQDEDDYLTGGGSAPVSAEDIAADAVVKAALMKFIDKAMRVAELTALLEEETKALNKANRTITDLLVERGWSALPLANGRKLEVKEGVYARWPANDAETARKFLENNEGADLIKESVVVDGKSQAVIDALSAVGAEFKEKVDVSTNSLQAYFRRMFGQTKGSARKLEPEDVPPCFSLYEKKEVVLK